MGGTWHIIANSNVHSKLWLAYDSCIWRFEQWGSIMELYSPASEDQEQVGAEHGQQSTSLRSSKECAHWTGKTTACSTQFHCPMEHLILVLALRTPAQKKKKWKKKLNFPSGFWQNLHYVKENGNQELAPLNYKGTGILFLVSPLVEPSRGRDSNSTWKDSCCVSPFSMQEHLTEALDPK